MSSHIVRVGASAYTVVSGGALELSIEYECDEGGEILFDVSDGFEISPRSLRVAPTAFTRLDVSVTVARRSAKTERCLITVSYSVTVERLLVKVS